MHKKYPEGYFTLFQFMFSGGKEEIKNGLGTSVSVNQEMSQKERQEIGDCFSALDLLKAMNRLVMFSNIMHSPAFSRMRELPKYNGAHNSFSGILQPNVKKKNRARSFLQLRPKHPSRSYSSAHFHYLWSRCLSATFITALPLGVLMFC